MIVGIVDAERFGLNSVGAPRCSTIGDVALTLARLFRGKMLAMLMHAHNAGQLTFFNTHAGLADKRTFKRFIAPLRRIKWVVYCKAPFAGPDGDLMGDSVNIAARLEGIADPGGYLSFRGRLPPSA